MVLVSVLRGPCSCSHCEFEPNPSASYLGRRGDQKFVSTSTVYETAGSRIVCSRPHTSRSPTPTLRCRCTLQRVPAKRYRPGSCTDSQHGRVSEDITGG